MDILDDTGVSKLSAIDFLKVNYSFNELELILYLTDSIQSQFSDYILDFKIILCICQKYFKIEIDF